MVKLPKHLRFLTPRGHNPHHPLFVFLPGMDGTGQLLRSQTESLTAAFDIRCLAIPPDDLNDWDILAKQVVALVKRELQPEPNRAVYLCGESFGGCLSLKVAIHAPWLFSRIILVNPASSFVKRPWLRWGAHVLPWLPDCLYRGAALGMLPFLISWQQVEREDRRTLLATMRSVPPQSVGWRLSLLGEFNISEAELRSLEQPVLVLAGTADRLLPSVQEAAWLVSRLPNARQVLLPQSGHACLLETEVNLYKIMHQEGFLPAQLQPRV